MRTDATSLSAGQPAPLGATPTAGGVNFALFSDNATRVTLCLFSDDGKREVARLDLLPGEGGIWHGHVAGLRPGALYGYRVDGPHAPEAGHRFNPAKLLLDPYARGLTGHPVWDDALYGYDPASPEADLSLNTADSAPFMPRCVVVDPAFDWQGDAPPRTPTDQSVIYEAHVRGLTMRHPAVPAPGSFAALASDPMLEHFARLGITAVELLPVHAFLDDRFLVDKGLTNYWGYQSIGFFAPEPRHLGPGGLAEMQEAVRRLHAAGIEVILDVVYNHTGEGGALGPTLSFRGIDNASYYRLTDDGRHCVDDTGTGNTLNLAHPMVLRMVMDSLRYWVEAVHVDGFRFDLCTTLGRTTDGGFDRDAAFFQAIRQDPVLSRVKLIAEPWDVGPGGYQLGAYPPPFLEWNDRFRDGVRRFWRGDAGLASDLAERLTGSAVQFDHSGRHATASVNFVTAHDGFTLADLTAYAGKHNAANGEDNRDGHDANHSDAMGHEGPTADAAITAARAQRRRNLMATLLLSQGTPMILAGDEIGNSQHGNNNAYCQDNAIGWLDWGAADEAFLAFTARLVAFRHAHPILRQTAFLHAEPRAVDGKPDVFWWRADGAAMTPADWDDPGHDHVAVEMRTASTTPPEAVLETALFLVFNAGPARDFVLPATVDGARWHRAIDTAAPEADPTPAAGAAAVAAQSVAVFVVDPTT